MLTDGTPNLIEGEVPLDIRSHTPLAPGAWLCDETGATATVARDSTISDIRVSATVRKAYQQPKYRTKKLGDAKTHLHTVRDSIEFYADDQSQHEKCSWLCVHAF